MAMDKRRRLPYMSLGLTLSLLLCGLGVGLIAFDVSLIVVVFLVVFGLAIATISPFIALVSPGHDVRRQNVMRGNSLFRTMSGRENLAPEGGLGSAPGEPSAAKSSLVAPLIKRIRHALDRSDPPSLDPPS